MKETIQKAIDRINAMSDDEFNAAIEESKKGEVYKALKELDEFSNYLFEQEELK
jgi:hypothetical protein